MTDNGEVGDKKSENGRGVRGVEEPWVISVPEAGRLIGFSRQTSYKLARQGIIPTIRVGRKLVVPRARFEAWVKRGVRGVTVVGPGKGAKSPSEDGEADV